MTSSDPAALLDSVSRWWTTEIVDIKPGVIRLRGYPIEQLIGAVDFPHIVWLMLRGELPTDEQSSLLEAALVAAVDHGPHAPSIAVARMAVSCGLPLNGAMASAINTLDDVHGGAGQQFMALLCSIDALVSRGEPLETATNAALDAFVATNGHIIAGFGHRFHSLDPRAPKLLELVDAATARGVVAGRYAGIARAVGAALFDRTGKRLTMNIDGATGTVYAELGFDPQLGRGLFLLSRAVGILAHAWEQSLQGARIKGPMPPTIPYRYAGVPPRAVPTRSSPSRQVDERRSIANVDASVDKRVRVPTEAALIARSSAQEKESPRTSLSLSHPDDCLLGWRDLLTNDGERAVIERFGRPVGLGSRPALLLIDFQLAYLGRNEPLVSQIDEYPAASGERGWTAFRNAMRVLSAARAIGVPVYATRVAFDPSVDHDVSFAGKRAMPGSFAVGSRYTRLPSELELVAGEELADKSAASAFFGTSLDEFIGIHSIDSLIVTGLSTSGCVRSTVVDAAARGLRPVVVVDAVGDRLQISHTVALLDMWMKYGDLCTSDALIDFANGQLAHSADTRLTSKAMQKT